MLHHSVLEGHTQLTEFLLESKLVPPTATDASQVTPLHLVRVSERASERACVSVHVSIRSDGVEQAAEWGRVSLIQQLIAKNAMPLAKDSRGHTPLHRAVVGSKLSCISQLMSRLPSDQQREEALLEADHNGNTPLHLACATGRFRVVEAIAPLYGARHIDVRDGRNQTALQIAAELNNLRIAQLLLTHGADRTVRDSRGRTVLHLAVEHRQTDLVRLLLGDRPVQKPSLSPNVKWIDGNTESDNASDALVVPEQAIAAAASLHLEFEQASQEANDLATRTAASLVNAVDADGNSALHVAVGLPDSDLALLLVDHGAKVELENADKRTPLQIAKSHNLTAFVARIEDGTAPTLPSHCAMSPRCLLTSRALRTTSNARLQPIPPTSSLPASLPKT